MDEVERSVDVCMPGYILAFFEYTTGVAYMKNVIDIAGGLCSAGAVLSYFMGYDRNKKSIDSLQRPGQCIIRK